MRGGREGEGGKEEGRHGRRSLLLPRQKEEEQEERTEKNGKEHGRRRGAPPLEIIACSRGISECGRKAVSGERQGPEPGYAKREREIGTGWTAVVRDGGWGRS